MTFLTLLSRDLEENLPRIYDSQRRWRLSGVLHAWLYCLTTPLALGIVIALQGSIGLVPALALSLGVSMSLFVLIASQFGRAANRRLREELASALSARYRLSFTNQPFVGLSPGKRPRVWAGESAWDVGFLVGTPDAVYFYGDAVSFQLPQRAYVEASPRKVFQILSLLLGPARFVAVRWRLGSQDHTLLLEPRATDIAQVLAQFRLLRPSTEVPATEGQSMDLPPREVDNMVMLTPWAIYHKLLFLAP